MTLILAAIVAAVAVPESARPDMQCLAVYTFAAGMAKTDAERLPALVGTAYFYGRLEVQQPALDLASALDETGTKLSALDAKTLGAMGAACDERVTAMGQRFTRASEALGKKP